MTLDCIVTVLLVSAFLLSQSSATIDVPRDLLNKTAAVQISTNDTGSCCSESGGCVQSSSPWCVFDGNSSTRWTLTPGQRKVALTVNLSAPSLIDHFEVSFVASSVIPSSFVMSLSGNDVTWMTSGNKSCRPSDRHLRKQGSLYYSCTPAGRLWNVSVPDGLFSARNGSSGWLWWRAFNRLQLTIEATDADYNGQLENSSIVIADVRLFGWNEPTNVCNCHPVGVEDPDVPCDSKGTCKCRSGISLDQCIPNFSDGNSAYGPISGGTKLQIEGGNTVPEYVQNVSSITIGNDYNCFLSPISNTTVEFQTVGANITDLGSPLPIWICWERIKEIKSCLTINSVFTYLPDPVVHSISPRKTIEYGGITQTVKGMNLDSARFSYITIYSVLSNGNLDNAYSYENKPYKNSSHVKCRIVNSTMLTCLTMPLYGVLVTSDHRLIIGISLDINSYNNYNTCRIVDGKCDFTFSKNPTINNWSDNPRAYPVYEGRKTVDVAGSGFLKGCGAHEYRLEVGGLTCEIVEVMDDKISFYPPNISSLKYPTRKQQTVLYVGAYHSWTVGDLKYITEPDRSALIGGLVGGIGGFILLVVVIVLIVICLKRRKEKKRRHPLESGYEPRYTQTPGSKVGPVTEYLSREVKAKVEKYTVPYKRIEIVHELGKGNFGKVFKGTFTDKAGIKQPVAIKNLHGVHLDIKDKVEFVEEAILMADFCHKHVLSLIAIVIEKDVPYVVLPLMELGDLRSFISKDRSSFNVGNLVNFSLQVAEGMEYLASMKFVHRDLAARNCMINKDFLVKVADFGLARDIFEKDYYRPQDNLRLLPFRWMALECLSSDREFTEKSDVWAFGVLVWELMTRGKRPYDTVDNLDLSNFIKQGGRLEKPSVAPDFIYNLMLRCWLPDRNDRPRFKDIVKELKEILSAAEANNAPTSLSAVNHRSQEMSIVVDANDSYMQGSGNPHE